MSGSQVGRAWIFSRFVNWNDAVKSFVRLTGHGRGHNTRRKAGLPITPAANAEAGKRHAPTTGFSRGDAEFAERNRFQFKPNNRAACGS